MKISVAMCTFQGERFLGEQLASIRNQERPPDEVIICDDGSTDQTVRILEQFCSTAPFPTRLIVNPRPLGTLKNFEQATRLCSGELIFFSDQDDIWHHNKLSTLHSALIDRPRAGLVFSDAEIVDEQLRPASYTLWHYRRFTRYRRRRIRQGRASPWQFILGQGIAGGMALGFLGRFKDLILPFTGLGHDLWVSTLIGAVAPPVLVDECLAKWRQHAQQQSGTIRARNIGYRLSEGLSHGASHYAELADGYQAVLTRLNDKANSYPCSLETLSSIESKIDHLRRRASIRIGHGKFRLVANELISLNYWKYSYGIRTVAKDLLLTGLTSEP